MTLLANVLDWIGRRTGTVIMVPHPTMIGNCGEHIYHGLIKARRQRKRLVLLFPFNLPWPIHCRLTNRSLLDIESVYRACPRNSPWFFAGSLLVTAYAAAARAINLVTRRFGRPLSDMDFYPCVGHTTLWQPEETMAEFSWSVVSAYDWPAQLQAELPVRLGAKDRAVGEAERRRLGMPDDAWFVCLHVRESGFHNDQMYERNASIGNYVEAIREITGRGGWVVRMGDPSMTRLPPMDRVIDYPFTDSKSALMDIYLLSECRAYVGMQSGIFDVATLFQRPMVLTNMASWLYPFPAKPGDVGVLKHVYSKSRQRFLSIREWMAEPFDAASFFALAPDYELHENDPEELRAAVAEFFERAGSPRMSGLQQTLSEHRVARGRQLIDQQVVSHDPFADVHQRYRLASRLDSALGVISEAYLERNWEQDQRTNLTGAP